MQCSPVAHSVKGGGFDRSIEGCDAAPVLPGALSLVNLVRRVGNRLPGLPPRLG